MCEEEEIYVSEDVIREEMIKEWCGKVKIHKSNKPTPILLLDLETPLKNSETLKKFQNKISEVLSPEPKKTKTFLILPLLTFVRFGL